MNCQQISDLLIDLAYEELQAPQRQAVTDHLAACGRCSEEYAQLRRARAALRQMRSGEPNTVRAVEALKAAPGGKTIRFTWRMAIFDAAAVAAIVVLVIMLHNPSGVDLVPEAMAREPVKVERVNVSVTILSQPPEWGQAMSMMNAPAQQGAPSYYQTESNYSGQHITQTDYDGRLVWPGMALVRDQRVLANMVQGMNAVQFTDVPTGILPDSVRMRSIDAPRGLAILEQNYQYDLASAWAILQKYLDKDLTVLFKDGASVPGRLLSFDEGTLVIQPAAPLAQSRIVVQGPRNISRQEIRAIAFEKLPEGLLTRPTLLWQLDNQAAARQQLEVAYLTTGLMWRADYVLKLHPAGQPAKGAGAAASRPARDAWKVSAVADFTDSADLIGYATVSNQSGVTYKDAQLKLIAGDVHLILPERLNQDLYLYKSHSLILGDANGARGFVEKSFFEYHLYTLGRPATIADREVKQLELVSGGGLKLRRNYVYDPSANQTAPRVVSEMENTEANGLGRPLPKGVIRLYAPDPDGLDTYVSQTEIDHTPVGEMLRLNWGFAFDIACKATQTDHRMAGSGWRDDWTYSLRNHKDRDVNVTIVVHVPITATRATCKFPWHVREVGVVEIFAPADSNSETKVDFSVEYNNSSGGGLKSPYDEALRH